MKRPSSFRKEREDSCQPCIAPAEKPSPTCMTMAIHFICSTVSRWHGYRRTVYIGGVVKTPRSSKGLNLSSNSSQILERFLGTLGLGGCRNRGAFLHNSHYFPRIWQEIIPFRNIHSDITKLKVRNSVHHGPHFPTPTRLNS